MGFAAESRERARPVLPLAGMVDVLFLLLVFFLVTYSMREQELQIPVDMSASEQAEPGTTQAQRVVITYYGDGRVFLGERQVTMQELDEGLARLAEITKDQPVILRGAKDATVELQSQIMDRAIAAGLGSNLQLGRVGKEQ